MKKLFHIGVTLFSAVIAVSFLLLAGPKMLALQTGPKPLSPDQNFADAAGTYISYEAAYPVASWEEEYYSGDPDRVKTSGYLIYDVARDAFVCITIPEQDDRDFDNLLHAMVLAADMRADRDMSPIPVDGSLNPASQEQADRALEALEESKVLEQYIDFKDSESYMKSYFADDEYGKVLGSMCEKLLGGERPSEWYVIEQGNISNMSTGEIWVCTVTALLNLLIFLFGLTRLLRSDKQQETPSTASGSISERYLAEQYACAKDWCTFNLDRGYRLASLSVLITLAIFVAIGILVKAADRLVPFYIPMGLLFGELIALLFWFTQASQSKPEKILKRFEKYLAKELPDAATRNAFIEEFVNTDQSWFFCEKTKEGMLWGKVGERYWSFFMWTGRVTIVDAAQLKELETETRSGSVDNGTVKVRYISYIASFYYQDPMPRRKPDKTVSFNVESRLGHFTTLAHNRVGDRVTITHK